jgi:hypothetical protein
MDIEQQINSTWLSYRFCEKYRPDPEECPYDPYEFLSKEELISYVERAKKETPGSLYEKARTFVSMYNDQEEELIVLIASGIVWTYFQDKFGTTHYDEIVGDNGSGKSTIGHTFESIGYRPVNMTDPSAANLFRILGTIEPGQCTIIVDEADNIDNSPQMMGILKSGYQSRGKVFKINMNSQKQEVFCAYCYKLIISERSLKQGLAKGVLDRTFVAKTFKGRPRFDIKESLNPAGDKKRQERLDELMDFRKLMLAYRLVHFQDPIADIEIELEGRDLELCKPTLQLFHGTNIVTEIQRTLTMFLNEKKVRNYNSLESALYPLIINLVSQHGKMIYVKQLWSELMQSMEGVYDEKKPNEFQTLDYDTIYRNTITKIICDKFGGRREHRKAGNVLIFDLDKLVRAGKAFDINVSFQSKLRLDKSRNKISEGSEGSKGSKEDIESPRTTNDIDAKSCSASVSNPDTNNLINYHKLEINNLDESKVKNTESTALLSSLLSLPSLPSPMPGIYRIGQTDIFGCKNCRNKGDRWFMQEHECSKLQ